jgi:hypothetical protein
LVSSSSVSFVSLDFWRSWILSSALSKSSSTNFSFLSTFSFSCSSCQYN